MNDRFIRGIAAIEEIVRVMKTGVTMPVECMLDNGQPVILKYPKNRAGSQVLPNELISYSIADLIGVNIPFYGIGSLSGPVIENAVNFNCDEDMDLDEQNSGLCFYSFEIKNSVPLITGLVDKAENQEVEKLVLLDYIVNNTDRHDGNILFSLSEKKAFVIDFSHIITKKPELIDRDYEMLLSDESILSIEAYRGNRAIYDMLSLKGFDEDYFMTLAKQIKNRLTSQVVDSVFARIPREWESYWPKNNLEKIKAIINRRIQLLEEAAVLILKERKG